MADDASGEGLPKTGPRPIPARPRGLPARGSMGSGAYTPGESTANGTTGSQLDQFVARLPGRGGRLPIAGLIWFGLSVGLPFLIAVVYFGLIASKQYEVEFHFTVRAPLEDVQARSVNSNSQQPAVLGRSVGNAGQSDTSDNYAVVDYITSAQAAHDLDQKINIRSLYGKSGVDPFSRFDPKKPQEQLSRYWRSMTYSTYDPASGLAIVKVRAFSPADVYSIATTLIQLCNDEVNSVGQRSRADSVKFAQVAVDEAQKRMDAARDKLQQLRNRTGVIDPTKGAVPENINQSDTLRANLTTLETRYAYLLAQIHNPTAPPVVALKGQISAVQGQLAAIDAQVNRNGQAESLANTVGDFERLDNERHAAEIGLITALENQQGAVAGAESQRLYLTTYVAPVMPESSTYPNRLASIGLTLLISGMVWLVGLLIAKSVMEHGR